MNELQFIVSQVVLDIIIYILVCHLSHLSVAGKGREKLLNQRQKPLTTVIMQLPLAFLTDTNQYFVGKVAT